MKMLIYIKSSKIILYLMGNDESDCLHSEYGYIYILTSKSNYYPGDIVSGNVYILQTKDFPCSILELTIRGREKVKWEELATGNQSNKENNSLIPKQEFLDKKELFRITQGLSEFKEGILQKGQYNFPFIFSIPESFPGSFEMSYGFIKAKISYSIKCVLRTSSANCKDLTFKQRLIISQKPKASILNELRKASSMIKSCLFSKGVSSISCRFEKDSYLPGETSKLLLSIDNEHCTAVMKSISVTLKQQAVFMIEKNSSSKVKNLDRVLFSKEFDGIPANNTTLNPRILELELVDVNQLYANPLVTKVDPIQPFIESSLIKCNYILSIEPFYETSCNCYDRPIILMPLYIIHPPLPNWNGVKIPSNWRPVDMKTTNIIFSPGQIQLSFYRPSFTNTIQIGNKESEQNSANPFFNQESQPLNKRTGFKDVSIELELKK